MMTMMTSWMVYSGLVVMGSMIPIILVGLT